MSGSGRPSPSTYADRAARAYAAMQRTFWTRRGLYRRDGVPRPPRAAAHLWPFARAFIATLDLAGLPHAPPGGFDPDAAIADGLRVLERYWDPTGPWPAYASDVIGTRWGGDRYYDDNAWVGLGLVQLERMRPGAGRLDRAAELVRFAGHGWDRRGHVPRPGGVFWVEQGRGVGATNHDRNTVSTAPNAALALHLAELGAAVAEPVGPGEMCDWVEGALHAGNDLFWDKIRGDGSIDRALWSYNQGNMIALHVLLARAGSGASEAHLARAETIAEAALGHYEGRYGRHPAAFNAIFFRDLLQLSAVTTRPRLAERISAALRGYADWAWSERRDRRDRFRFSGAPTLLDQSAMVSVLALSAWDPADYGSLA